MTNYVIDTTLRLRIPHRPGQLARIAAAIATEGAVVGEITTVRVAGTDTVRDITVETTDEGHTARVVDAVRGLEGIELIQTTDRVFDTHRGGKIRTASRVPVEQLRDLRYVYTPGVARVATAIAEEPERAWELTGVGNSVGIFTNGSRVLGLGNIGPLASLPVMEGKAVLYDKFAGISATPVLVDTLDADEFIETVVRLAPTFGAIHLEDIRIPECYRIEQELDRRLAKPVMHDDQWGTATAALAALLNACRAAGRDLKSARVGQIGLGAAGSAIALLAIAYGVGDVMVTDLSPDAVERMRAAGAHPVDLATLLREADIVIATTGRPGLITPSMVRKGQVIFALSNPDPEIRPEDAVSAGAAFAADGRSINNALAYPGLFKGALEVRSRAITKPMLIAAAEAIADHAEPGEVVPSPLSLGVHNAVRQAVVSCARAAGLENTARVEGGPAHSSVRIANAS